MTGPSFAPSRNAASGVSLSGDHRGSSHPRQRQKLQQQKHAQQPAIKKISSLTASSSNQHAKLHKRGASFVLSTSLMSSSPDAFRSNGVSPSFASEGQRLITSPFTSPLSEVSKATVIKDIPSSSTSSVAPSRIKPYLRKLSSKDETSNGSHFKADRSKTPGGDIAIDLSRPAAENRSLTGLGITDYGVEARSVQETSHSALGRQAIHTRSTSNTSSQFSAGSTVARSADCGLHRPTAPYVHPMRQTPRPFTPPIPAAIQDSFRDSGSVPITHTGSISDFDGDHFARGLTEMDPQTSGSVSSSQTAGMVLSAPSSFFPRAAAATPSTHVPTRLHLNTTAPTFSLSQTSFLGSGTPQTRSRGNTLLSIDTVTASGTATTPSSRTSLDRALTFIRGRDRDGGGGASANASPNVPVDPAEKRAAHIRAARQAYRAKEEAKARKAEKTLLKKEEKHLKRRLRKEEAEQRSRLRFDANILTDASEKPAMEFNGVHTGGNVGSGRKKLAQGQTGGPAAGAGFFTSSSSPPRLRSHWLAFITWLRTRLLKIGRKLHIS